MSGYTYQLLLALLFVTSLVADQSSKKAKLMGVVQDPSTGPVPNTSVELRLPGKTKVLKNAITDNDGVFVLAGLKPRTYEFCFFASGFKRVCRIARTEKFGTTKLGVVHLRLGDTSGPIVVEPHIPE